PGTIHEQASATHQTGRASAAATALRIYELLLVIPHVGIFRFVAELGWKLRIASMNVRNVGWEHRIVAFPPCRKGKCQYLKQASHMSSGRATHASHDPVASSCRISVVRVDGRHRHKNLRR